MKPTAKTVIYQVLPRLFGNTCTNPVANGSKEVNGCGKFDDFTDHILEDIKGLGATHIWYTGILAHASQTDYSRYGITRNHNAVVKGRAGSPYAIRDYYDVDPDLANAVESRMDEFDALIARTHRAGLKAIIDFVPNHVSRQYRSDTRPSIVWCLGVNDDTTKAFAPNNNFYYLPGQSLMLPFGAEYEDFEYTEFPARATGNDCFSDRPGRHDWYDTVKLNYGVDLAGGGSRHFDPIPNTWHKMCDILRFWAGKGVDGFRCDMAEMVPVEFWQWVIPKVKAINPALIFIAEIYRPELYRDYLQTGRFDYLYDKVGLYDTLRDVVVGNAPAAAITRCWQAVEGIQSHMLNFMENHDEQRIASDFFARSGQAGFPAMVVAALMNTNPVMCYFGQELGEPGMDAEGFSGTDGRTTIFDYWRVDTIQRWIGGARLTDDELALQASYRQLLGNLCREPAVVHGAFFDLMYVNHNNPHFDIRRHYAFLRKEATEVLLIVVNFGAEAATVSVNIPAEAFSMLDIPDNQAALLTDLITGRRTTGTLTHVAPCRVDLPAYSATVLKFDYSPRDAACRF